jgi:mannose-6-phosphate isomerase-like protein (cupin superfamily)
MNIDERTLAPTKGFYIHSKDVRDERITAVEGVVEDSTRLTLKKLLVGEDMVILSAFKGKGMKDPMHQHDDHESVGYLVSGRMRLVIGGVEFIAEPGTAWIHPRGVPHFSEALEDCVQLEIKSPPKKTWTST